MKIVLLLPFIAALCGTDSAGPKPIPVLPTKAPTPSYCRAIWHFTTSCAEVNSTLIHQIKAFSPNAGCDVCSYLFVSADNVTLTADHSSSDGFGAETIIFKLTPGAENASCQLFVQSQSLGAPTTLDNAVNYCNLYDLLTASGLSSEPGFSDKTNIWVCPGFGMTTCKA